MSNVALRRLRRWWMDPPRTGIAKLLAPWEYRHLRLFGGLRIGGGIATVGLGCVTLAYGGANRTAYGWALGFGVLGVAEVAFGCWELSIAGAAGKRS